MWVQDSFRRVVRSLEYNRFQITLRTFHGLSRSKVSAAKIQRVRRLTIEELLHISEGQVRDKFIAVLGRMPAENKVGAENAESFPRTTSYEHFLL